MAHFPRLLLITGHSRMRHGYEYSLRAAVEAGAHWFLFREKQLGPAQVVKLFSQTHAILQPGNAQLYCSNSVNLAKPALADGIHLSQAEFLLFQKESRAVLDLPTGVSVHSLQEAKAAQAAGAHYLLFGPVFPTNTHPGHPGVGLNELARVAGSVEIPVLAVGGITKDLAPACLESGAYGVACIDAAWAAPDVADAVKSLILATGEARSRGKSLE